MNGELEALTGQMFQIKATKKELRGRNSLIIKSPLSESNQRPTDYKSVALPAELRRLNFPFAAPDSYRDGLKEGAKISQKCVSANIL